MPDVRNDQTEPDDHVTEGDVAEVNNEERQTVEEDMEEVEGHTHTPPRPSEDGDADMDLDERGGNQELHNIR